MALFQRATWTWRALLPNTNSGLTSQSEKAAGDGARTPVEAGHASDSCDVCARTDQREGYIDARAIIRTHGNRGESNVDVESGNAVSVGARREYDKKHHDYPEKALHGWLLPSPVGLRAITGCYCLWPQNGAPNWHRFYT